MHFAKHFSPQQFGVAPQGRCEMVVHEVCVMLDLHIDWVVLQMNIYMPLISYHKQPFFKSCSFLPWISFSHLLNDFMHAHPHYISCRRFDTNTL
jgi:hypothetical protein